jgi:hypothetical protein
MDWAGTAAEVGKAIKRTREPLESANLVTLEESGVVVALYLDYPCRANL